MVFKKKKRTKWGTFYRSEYEFEAMRWCVNNNIKIGPLATTPGTDYVLDRDIHRQ